MLIAELVKKGVKLLRRYWFIGVIPFLRIQPRNSFPLFSNSFRIFILKAKDDLKGKVVLQVYLQRKKSAGEGVFEE